MKGHQLMASDNGINAVTVLDNGAVRLYRTVAANVKDFMAENGIAIYEKDICSVDAQHPVSDGLTIIIERALGVTVNINGSGAEITVSPGTTAGQILLSMQAESYSALVYEGDGNQTVADRDVLDFYTWETQIITVSETLPYETIEGETAAMLAGRTNVRQPGTYGEKQYTVALVLIGGEVRQRAVINEEILREPVPEIIDFGIGGKLGTHTDTSCPSFFYRDMMVMNASAYTAGFESTGKNPGDPGYGITKTGVPVNPGIVAVDPTVIPLGSLLYVEGYGFSLAADIGSAIKGNRIDLYIESLEAALRFGRRDIIVYILEIKGA
jgi:3D (Asp-Asp-Asp) domain-containing protein